jgi:hypothetical protein
VTSPDDNNTKEKTHVLKILLPTIRLSRDKKEVAEKLKDLVHQSMPYDSEKEVDESKW